MHLFGMLGMLSFIFGFIITGYLTYTKFFMLEYKMTDRPIFYLALVSMIIGVQLFVAGFLAELISRGSHDRNNYLVETKLNID